MSVRKRTWKTAQGERREAWIVDYVDSRNRHIRTFDKKKAADAFETTMRSEVANGIHTPDSQSITVAEAGKLWLKTAEGDGLERSTTDEYKRHLDLHILPRLGHVKLSRLSSPLVRNFTDKLRADGMSPAMVAKVRTSLVGLVNDAQERGLVAVNVARQSRRKRRGAGAQERGKRLKTGVDVPTPTEIASLLEAAKPGRARALLMVAVFTGLRASELRGLTWDCIDFRKGELHVRQRADRYRQIGAPKSRAGERTIPIPAQVLAELREWRLACPKGPVNLVFPTAQAMVIAHGDIVRHVLAPTMMAAKLSVVKKDAAGKVVHDETGKPVRVPKYSGLHCLRHFFASWCINRKADGGLELPVKTVQTRLGHATVTLTMDVYGHLFPGNDDTAELSAAAGALLGQPA
jgi:integrase